MNDQTNFHKSHNMGIHHWAGENGSEINEPISSRLGLALCEHETTWRTSSAFNMLPEAYLLSLSTHP